MSNDGRKRILVSGKQDIQMNTMNEVHLKVGILAAMLQQAVQVEMGPEERQNLK